MRSFLTWIGLLLIAGLCAMNCFAQGTNGKITGSVTDASGGVIAGSTVTVTRVDSGVRQTVTTDSSGNYSLLALPPSTYNLQVQATGFKTYGQNGIKVDVQSALQINVVMSVGSAETKIEVTAEAVRVEAVNTQVGNVIGASAVQSIPLNGRSYTDLMALQPGVNSATADTGSSSNQSYNGSAATGNVSINGQKESANGFMVNGGNVENSRNNGAALVPNLDAIAEFRVVTNNVDAEYGHYSGGMISVVTKSGTNAFHGDVFDYLRNTSLDAKNFYLPERGVFQRNQFGGTFGGPIKKDKLFFFADYQGTRQVQEISEGRVPLPTAANRSGDFSATAASELTGFVGGPYFACVLGLGSRSSSCPSSSGPGRLGYAVASGEPYFFAGCTTATCVFPGGIIPPAALDPVAKNLAAQIPLPNEVVNGLGYFTPQGSSANNQRTDANQGGVRIDYNTSRWGMISGYYAITPSTVSTPFGIDKVPGYPTSDNVRTQQLNISDTKSFGSTAVNEFRINVLRLSAKYSHPTHQGPSLSALGFVTPWSASTGGITPADPSDSPGSPTMGFNNYSVGVPNPAYSTYQTNPQAVDNFSKVVGNHTAKMGVEFQPSYFAERLGVVQEFVFDGSETGSDFADLLIGAPLLQFQFSVEAYNSRKSYWGAYGQDSWKLRPNLTVNYGLRWDYIPNWRDRKAAYTYVPGEQSVVYPTAPRGLVFAGDRDPLGGTIPLSVSRTPLKDFAPRIGIAYSPGSGKTSIRAAWGLFYTNNEGSQIFSATGGVPFVAAWSSSIPPLLFEPYRRRVDGTVDKSPPFPGYIPPPPGVTSYKGCPTCPVAPITWLTPIAGDFGWNLHNVTSYAEDYHVTIQRQLGAATVLSVGYVGSQGHHLQVEQVQNPGNAQLCLSLSQPSEVAPGTPTCGPFGQNTVYTRADGTIVNGTRAPYGNQFGENSFTSNTGNSHYNALQVSLQHSSQRLSLSAAYSYSKAIDQSVQGLSFNLNPYNNRLSYGLASFDVPQALVISYNYLLPFDRLWSNRPRLTGGWRVAGVTRFADGVPVPIRETDDHALLGVGSNIDTPIYSGAPLSFTDPRSNQPFFNTAAFSKEPLGVLNTLHRSFFHGPGINNFDMSLIKDTKITERTSLEFRAEFFNIFNHAQFLNPSGNISSSAFGRINTARAPRIGQLALKMLF
jgi:hypothetical protein